MLFEDIQITDPVLDKLWTDQLSGSMPLIKIGDKDGVTEEVFPFLVEWFTLSIGGELSGQDGFNVLWIGSKDETTASRSGFHGVAHPFLGSEPFDPVFETAVCSGSVDGVDDKVDAWIGSVVEE